MTVASCKRSLLSRFDQDKGHCIFNHPSEDPNICSSDGFKLEKVCHRGFNARDNNIQLVQVVDETTEQVQDLKPVGEACFEDWVKGGY